MTKAETKAAGGEDQSMEEILQSIRRIIAEENDEEGAEPKVAEKAAPVAGSDILELTDEVTEEGAVVNLQVSSAQALADEIEFDAVIPADEPPAVEQEKPLEEDVLKNIDEALKTAEVPAISGAEEDSLLSRAAAEATSQALKHLKRPHPENHTMEMPGFRSGMTIEDLVMEGLRPMLKNWLDTNLPGMVERIVEREIRKLTQ